MFAGLTYEARIRLILDWLDPVGEGFLSRFKAPTGFTHEGLKGEISEIAEAVNEDMPAKIGEDEFKAMLEKVGKAIRKTARTRSWPQIRDFVEQVREVQKAAVASAGPRSVEELHIDHAMRWISRGNGPISTYDGPEVVRAAIDRGVSTAEELHRMGYRVPRDLRETPALTHEQRRELADAHTEATGSLRLGEFEPD